MSTMTDVKHGFESQTSETELPPPSYEEVYSTSATSRNPQLPSQALTPFQPSSSTSSQSDTFRPVVIPQINASHNGPSFPPFTRAYAPTLTQYSISQTDFLTFIDGLNSAFATNSGLSVVSSAGAAIGRIHLPIVPLLGKGVAAAAGLASSGTGWTRAKSYVKTANEGVFVPKGLRVKILKTGKMMEVACGRQGGRLDLLPLEAGEDNDPQTRRLRALGDRVAPLVFEGQASEGSDTWWKRWEAKEAQKKDGKMKRHRGRAYREWEEKRFRAQREEARYDERIRQIEAEKRREATTAEQRLAQTSSEDSRERTRIGEDLERRLRDLDREEERVLQEKDRRLRDIFEEGEDRMGHVDYKEQGLEQKMYWIVIDKVNGLGQAFGGEDDIESLDSKE